MKDGPSPLLGIAIGAGALILLAVGFALGRARGGGGESAPGRPPGPPVAPPADAQAAIESLIRQNELISAIKLYRERTGAGLKEAKDAVEAMKARMG